MVIVSNRFRAPRFDAAGKKIENARLVRVLHNGELVQENEEVDGETGAHMNIPEAPLNPLILPGDHGPVAYRSIYIHPLGTKAMITRREAMAALAAPALYGAKQDKRPNFVFVLVDDLRWDALSATGHPFVKTPNIDRLAREGVTFTNAFVTTPLCSPSRASYLTGRYVHAHGIEGNGDSEAASHQLTTFPLLLHDGGYETAYVGKWHMGTDDSPRPGIDRWVSFRGQGVYEDPPLNIDGKQIKATGYMTDLLSGHAADFIRKDRTKPFCLYLAHKAVHGPFTPAARHKDLFASNEIQRASSAQDTLEGKLARQQRGGQKAGRGPNDEVIRNQLRCLTAIDEGFAQILKALEDTKQLDETVVVFTSDNGYFWGEHGLGDKRWAYEESIRIPMLVRYPKMAKAGSKTGAMALNVDIAPTFLDFAGITAPKSMHGRSLVPVIKGKRSARRSFLAEYFEEKNFPNTPTWQAVREERWKYIRYPDMPDADELYDLQADRLEMKNLIREASAQGAATRLRAEMARLLGETI